MPESKFVKAINFVFPSEGGYSNHPSDRGGATNMGITHSTLIRAKCKGIVSHSDIKALTRKEAEEIYHKMYWTPSKAGYIFEPLCVIYFDAVVNHGLGGAGRLLQRTILDYSKKAGLAIQINVDGAVGIKTLAALKACVDLNKNLPLICEIFNNQREKLYHRIVKNNPSQECFLRGWLNRLSRNRSYCENFFKRG